jgi:hypothetical protein
MRSANPLFRKAQILAPGRGRSYSIGRIHADTVETHSRFPVSEWWLEPYAVSSMDQVEEPMIEIRQLRLRPAQPRGAQPHR